MDSQLNPLPPPGGRPFFNRFVVLGEKKSLKETIDEVKAKSKCAILYTNPIKPKFNFISDEKIHHCTHVSSFDHFKCLNCNKNSLKFYSRRTATICFVSSSSFSFI